MFELNIKTLVHGGQGLAHDETGHPFFVWNALPGETVLAERIIKKKDYSEAIARDILVASPHRLPSKENSYLSTSPWQIMDFAYENEMKSQIANETYQHLGNIHGQRLFGNFSIVTDGIEYGYRNKMEFSFTEDQDGVVQLAFFNRGTKNKIPVAGSILATNAINKTAQNILSWIREQKITNRSLKAVIVRSNQKGETIAALFIKDELVFDKYPELGNALVGFTLYYSTHKSPASVPTKLLYQVGQNFLEEQILGTTLRYGIFSFFQVNIPVFETALQDIAQHILPDIPVVDYYSGVGTISFVLADKISSCVQVEENEEATHFAKINQQSSFFKTQDDKSTINNNFSIINTPSEKSLEFIAPDLQLILDPPRAGLHDRVVAKILEETPQRVIYLSCNIATQARDLEKLKEKYDIIYSHLYNFFPRTPHIEGLVVLDQK